MFLFLLDTRSLVGVSGIALFLLGSVVQSSLRKRYSGSAGATPLWLHPGPLRIKHNWPARVQQRPATPVPVRQVSNSQQVSTCVWLCEYMELKMLPDLEVFHALLGPPSSHML
jgi:hypothetical protein